MNHGPFGIMGLDFLPWEDLQMDALLEGVVAISSGLDLPSTLRRIVAAAVGLVDATYGALGVSATAITWSSSFRSG